MVHLSCGSLCCIYRDYHAYRNHLKRYGHPSEIGYKDVLRTWNPTNLDPKRLTELYQKAGARFLMIQGVHHDNYDLWNSRYQPWNSIVNSCNGQAGTSDSYTSKAITCDKFITIEGGTFNIVMSGTGGKGVKTDAALVIGKDDGTGPAMKIATTGSKLSGGSTSGSTQPGSNRPGGKAAVGETEHLQAPAPRQRLSRLRGSLTSRVEVFMSLLLLTEPRGSNQKHPSLSAEALITSSVTMTA